MKRLSLIVVSLLVVVFTGFGCAGQTYTQEGWITLIDGASGLENWNRVGDGNWRAEDGAIVVDRTPDKAYSYLMTKNAYSNFQIRVEFWVSHDANSGVFMRCSDLNKISDKTCYEANIFDERKDPTYGTGAITHISPVSPMPKAGGKWNVYEITVKGDRMTLVLNGKRTADARDGKFASGPIGLQYAAGVVKFRKFQIKPL
ncbi:MAG: DUF1080 domain-containing protein [Sulfuricaulis sp.]|uniref:DUF1080 domain-containing protein n=1 Tax=Sulfuricaulis sp. TaxID=2003553 RepID=UPI0034A2B632